MNETVRQVLVDALDAERRTLEHYEKIVEDRQEQVRSFQALAQQCWGRVEALEEALSLQG